jgi:single-strand DNA-binding protein
MRSVNKVILVGNLTRDPELKQTTGGQSIVTFGIATNREWVTRSTEKKSLAEYHNIAAWGRLAEICSRYLKKGKLVYVEGYLKTRSWDSPEGVRIFKTEVVATDMIMLDKRPKDEGEDEEQYVPTDDNVLDEENIFNPDSDFNHTKKKNI